jgi:cysteine desulfurase family protein (TIGR01976 family)
MDDKPENANASLADRSDFPSLERKYKGHTLSYFDGPAGVQVPRQVIDRIVWYYSHCNANVHGYFVTSKESDQVVEEARRRAAEFLGASGPENISFGANMTTLAFALSHAVGRHLIEGDEVVITQLDHEANRAPWLGLRKKGIVIREVKMFSDGTLDYEDFEQNITKRTRMVAVGYASNAVGTVNDISRVEEMAHHVGAWLVVDAVHYAPHLLIDFDELGADFLLCSAYKFYGPHVGILCSRKGLLDQLETDLLRTQIQKAPWRIETGTLNHAALAGVSAAVEYIAALGDGENFRACIATAMERIRMHEGILARHFYDGLKEIAGVTVYGPSFDDPLRAPTVSFTLEGHSAAAVATFLGEQGLLVWAGHFYAIRAVEILGLADRGGLVRVGMSVYIRRSDVERLLDAIQVIASGKGGAS